MASLVVFLFFAISYSFVAASFGIVQEIVHPTYCTVNFFRRHNSLFHHSVGHDNCLAALEKVQNTVIDTTQTEAEFVNSIP